MEDINARVQPDTLLLDARDMEENCSCLLPAPTDWPRGRSGRPRARRSPRPPEVRLEHRAHAILVHRGLDLAHRGLAGVVRDDIDAAKLGLSCGEHVDDVLRLGDVELDGEEVVKGTVLGDDFRAARGRLGPRCPCSRGRSRQDDDQSRTMHR